MANRVVLKMLLDSPVASLLVNQSSSRSCWQPLRGAVKSSRISIHVTAGPRSSGIAYVIVSYVVSHAEDRGAQMHGYSAVAAMERYAQSTTSECGKCKCTVD